MATGEIYYAIDKNEYRKFKDELDALSMRGNSHKINMEDFDKFAFALEQNIRKSASHQLKLRAPEVEQYRSAFKNKRILKRLLKEFVFSIEDFGKISKNIEDEKALLPKFRRFVNECHNNDVIVVFPFGEDIEPAC